MESPASHPAVAPPQASPNPSDIGQRIGPYDVIEPLGEGGFGTVFVAEQSHPIQRRVALKLIKAGMDTQAVIARFESERQALALMEHPNIARVLDAGSTLQGRPFFAMELVRGLPITRYCDDHRLSVAGRLDLFLQVCGAIQHAHQKGIIHRDIKPSNVLVADTDGVPIPKVIDFGIAKAIHGSLADRTALTQTRQVVGTPNYVSPEQVRGDGEDIDTRCDIYSLGVLLYELMCGAPPFDSKEIAHQGADALWRAVVEQDPERPSARIQRLAREEAEAVARQRSTSPRTLAALMAGDLDWIIMRCLEKDRRLRYESAHALAEDVARYLDHSPVKARPPSKAYRLQKAWSRHRAVIAFAAALVVALASGTVVSAWQARRAAEARNEAVALARENAFVAQLLFDVFNQINLKNIRGGAERLDQALERRLREVASRLTPDVIRQPLNLVELKVQVGGALLSLGNPADARVHLDDALAILRREKGARHPGNIPILASIAHTHRDEGNLERARALYEEALPLALALDGQGSPQAIRVQRGLAGVYLDLSRLDLAVPLLEQVVSDAKAAGPLDGRQAALALSELGMARILTGDADAALRLLEEARDRLEALGDPDDPDLLLVRSALGLALVEIDRLPEVIALFGETLQRLRKVFGPNHLNTLRCMISLSNAYKVSDDYAAALAMAEDVLKLFQSKFAPDHPDAITALANVGALHAKMDRPELAIPMLEEALQLSSAKRGPNHPDTLRIGLHLGEGILKAGDLQRAMVVLGNALSGLSKALGAESPDSIEAMSEVAHACFVSGNFIEADRLYQRVLEWSRRRHGPSHRFTSLHLGNAALARKALGHWADAIALQTEHVQRLRERRGTSHPVVLDAEGTLALFTIGSGDVAKGLELLERVLAGQTALGEPAKAQATTTARNIAIIRLDQAVAASAWPAAAEALAAWTVANPGEFWPWCQLLCIESHLGRAEAFHPRARELTARQASATNTLVIAWVAKASLLLPSPNDPEHARRALAAADRVAADGTHPGWKPFGDFVRALALLRLGRPSEALPFAREAAVQDASNPIRAVQAETVLALCHVQLGQAEAARDALHRARQVLGTPFAREPKIPGDSNTWHDLLIAMTLGREAEEGLAALPQAKAPVAASAAAVDNAARKQP